MGTMTEPSTVLFQAPPSERLRMRSAEHDERCRTALARRTGLANVSCRRIEGKVVLSGTVRSFYLKQVAQEILRTVEGVAAIENRLEVT